MKRFELIRNKSKFDDLFLKARVDNKYIFEIQDYESIVKNKVEKRIRQNLKTKL